MRSSLLTFTIFFCVRFTCQKSQEVVTKSVPVTKSKCENVVAFVTFWNVVKSDFYFLNLYSKGSSIICNVHA